MGVRVDDVDLPLANLAADVLHHVDRLLVRVRKVDGDPQGLEGLDVLPLYVEVFSGLLDHAEDVELVVSARELPKHVVDDGAYAGEPDAVDDVCDSDGSHEVSGRVAA